MQKSLPAWPPVEKWPRNANLAAPSGKSRPHHSNDKACWYRKQAHYFYRRASCHFSSSSGMLRSLRPTPMSKWNYFGKSRLPTINIYIFILWIHRLPTMNIYILNYEHNSMLIFVYKYTNCLYTNPTEHYIFSMFLEKEHIW